jgi:hypothetical protein
MIYAWRGVGKTFVALNIAYAVASGGTFFGWRTQKPRRVLYLDGEMVAADLQMRLRGIALGDQRDFDDSYLRILTPDLQRRPMPDLATRAGQAEVDAISKDTELIIIDNISTLVRDVARENDAESWNEVGAWALRMRQKGRSVLFLHHSGKGGSQRGSSKKEDTLDVVISLKLPPDYTPDQKARFEVHFEKARNGGGEELRPFEAALKTDAEGKPNWTSRPVEESNFNRVVALATAGMSQREIAAELRLNKSTVSRHWRDGQQRGLIPGQGR